MQIKAGIRIEGLVLVVVGAAAAATVLPVQGTAEVAVNVVTKVAIAALFVLYGARISAQDALQGISRWRLHALVLACTFIVYPILGLLARPLVPVVLSESVYIGLMFLCLVATSTLSTIAFTATARGSVADAVIAVSISNVLGIFLTPLLVLALMSDTGQVRVDSSVLLNISLQLLVPFVIGQALRPRLKAWLADSAHHIRFVERSALALVVYCAFCAGVDDDVWRSVSALHIAGAVVVCIALFAIMLWITKGIDAVMRFSWEERMVLQFCGTQKSLATGLPMALVIFPDQRVGLISLPLIIYYQVQIIAGSTLAQRYAHRHGGSHERHLTS